MFKRRKRKILAQYKEFAIMFPEREARNIIKAIIRGTYAKSNADQNHHGTVQDP